MQTLEALNLSNEVIISKNTSFVNAENNKGVWDVIIKQNNQSYKIQSKSIINCAGLNSIDVAMKKVLRSPTRGSQFNDLISIKPNSIVSIFALLPTAKK